MEVVECPKCAGKGGRIGAVLVKTAQGCSFEPEHFPCEMRGGSSSVSEAQAKQFRIGVHIERLRSDDDISLREAAKANRWSATDWSALERGMYGF